MAILLTTVVTWLIFFFLLKVIDVLSYNHLSRTLRRNNVSLKFGFISYHTSRFNRRVETLAKRHVAAFQFWFSLGSLTAFFGFLLSIYFLTTSLIASISALTTPSLHAHQSSTSFTFPAAKAHTIPHFQPRARIPFLKRPPPWIPNATWALLTANDHHPIDLRTAHIPRNRHSPSAHPNKPYPPHSAFQHPRHDNQPHPPPPSQHHPSHIGQVVRMSGWRRQRRIDAIRRKRPLKPPRYVRHLLAVDPSQPVSNESRVPHHHRFLTPLVPGVTIPAGDIWYMLLSVLFAAAVHEIGHALAAVSQEARLSAMGVFLALAIPGAYVRLTGIEKMPIAAQLRVYCAGVWHNVITAVLAIVVVLSLPGLMASVYARNVGALVVDVPRISPLHGHVRPGDIIIGMGGETVVNGGQGFRNVISVLMEKKQSVGFCIGGDVLRQMRQGDLGCCKQEVIEGGSGRLQCFRKVELPADRAQMGCFDPALVSSRLTCRATSDCAGDREICVVAVLAYEQQLIDIRVRSLLNGDVLHFFYEGYAHILGQSITVSSYIPRGWQLFPALYIKILSQIDIPNILERFLQYLCSISLGLAVMNMAPVLYFDGEASCEIFVRYCGKWLTWSEERIRKVHRILVGGGSLLIAMNVIIAIADLGL